jgi:hypothetical protein
VSLQVLNVGERDMTMPPLQRDMLVIDDIGIDEM